MPRTSFQLLHFTMTWFQCTPSSCRWGPVSTTAILTVCCGCYSDNYVSTVYATPVRLETQLCSYAGEHAHTTDTTRGPIDGVSMCRRTFAIYNVAAAAVPIVEQIWADGMRRHFTILQTQNLRIFCVTTLKKIWMSQFQYFLSVAAVAFVALSHKHKNAHRSAATANWTEFSRQ